MSQAGRQATLRPGDLTLLDSARPYTIQLVNAGCFEHIVYQIPRATLEHALEASAAPCRWR